MACVIHATTMNMEIASPCLVVGSMSTGMNQIARGTRTHKTWLAIVR